MKKPTYNGSISQDVKNFDLADINVYNWFAQFPKNLVSQKESELIDSLISTLKKTDSEKNYTFSDDRFVLIAIKLLSTIKKQDYSFTISEYLIFYRYIQTQFDKSINGIENLIEFVNQMIGFSAEGGALSDEQYQILSETAESIELQALRMCPLFIAEDIEAAMKLDSEKVDMAGVEVLEKPEEKDLIDEIEELEEEEEVDEILQGEEETFDEPKDEPSEIAEWRDTITTLQELIDENDSPESNAEWQDTIDTLKELIADSGYSYAFGGMTTNRNVFAFRIPIWAVSALINADLSGLEDDEIEKLDQFVDETIAKYGNAHFMLGEESDEVEFKRSNDIDGNVGGDVTKLYLISNKYYAEGGEVDEIRAEIEKQEKKLGLASLPESAKDVIRKKIEQLKGRLSADESKPESKPKVETQLTDDNEIRAEIEKQEKKLGLASLPESAKDVIRKKIDQLKGRLSADKPKPESTPKPKPKVVEIEEEESPIEKIKRSKKMLDIDEFEFEEISPIEKIRGKKEVEEQEVKVPKKRGRKPKPKPEIVEPKIPKKRGRKPKPKPEIVEPKVPQKRGRKPKPKLSLADFGISSKFNINDFI